MSHRTLIAGFTEVKRYLSMEDCIEAIEKMFKSLANGGAILPLRQVMWLPDRSGALATMPAFVKDDGMLGAKIITVFPGNAKSRYESHQGVVLLFETTNGCMLSIMDATSITSIRTAAASAVATRALSRKESKILAIIGAGAQAESHLRSIPCVRDIAEVRIWSRNRENAKRVSSEVPKNIEIVRVCENAEQAIRGADIVCTTTSSSSPVVEGSWLSNGAHINAVGSSTPTARELDSLAVARSKLFVDNIVSAKNEAGDFLIPLKEGTIKEGHIVGDIGEVLTGRVKGRENKNEITLFKSLGIATEDIAAASVLYEKMKSTAGERNWIEFSGFRK